MFVAEPTSEALSRWIECNGALSVSALAAAEFASAISRRRRMGQFSQAQGLMALDSFDAWVGEMVVRVTHTTGDIEQAGQLVRRPIPKLLAADAIHLTTCARLRYTLVTEDQGLLAVAALIGLAVITPSVEA